MVKITGMCMIAVALCISQNFFFNFPKTLRYDFQKEIFLLILFGLMVFDALKVNYFVLFNRDFNCVLMICVEVFQKRVLIIHK